MSVFKMSGPPVYISRELLDDMPNTEAWHQTIHDAWANACDEIDDEMRNGHLGPRLGPSRSTLWDMQRPERVRENIRYNLRELMPHHKPGRFIRAAAVVREP